MSLLLTSLRSLEAERALVVAPVGPLSVPLYGSLGLLDQLLGGPVCHALERQFFTSRAGDYLLVAPGEAPLAGILLIGYGEQALEWAQATEIALSRLSTALPKPTETVAILPPQPTSNSIPVTWKKASERFVPMMSELKKEFPLKKYMWIDLEQEE